MTVQLSGTVLPFVSAALHPAAAAPGQAIHCSVPDRTNQVRWHAQAQRGGNESDEYGDHDLSLSCERRLALVYCRMQHKALCPGRVRPGACALALVMPVSPAAVTGHRHMKMINRESVWVAWRLLRAGYRSRTGPF
jgi:hypothetical protein